MMFSGLTNLRTELIESCKDESLPKPRRAVALSCLDELDLGIAQIANHTYPEIDIVDLPTVTADAQREIHLFVALKNRWWNDPNRQKEVWELTQPKKSSFDSPVETEIETESETDLF